MSFQQQPQQSRQKKENFKPCKNTGCTSLITFTKKPDGSGWLVLERDLARSELVEHKCKFYNKSQPQQQQQVAQPQQTEQQQQRQPPPITAGSETQKEIRAIKAQLLVLIQRLERLERGF